MRACGKMCLKNWILPKLKIYLANNFKDDEIFKIIKENNLKYILSDARALDNMMPHNQGIVEIYDYEYGSLDDIKDDELVLILDHLKILIIWSYYSYLKLVVLKTLLFQKIVVSVLILR